MIPKTIHYCWFGRSKKPRIVEKCIRSWKRYCPEYTIIEWNEDNYDLESAPLFVKQAIEAKKWAFASDYVRIKVVYEYGGFYLDTDVELIQSLDGLIHNRVYFGFMIDNQRVATGLGFGAEKGSPILAEIMRLYEDKPFKLANNTYDLTTNSRKETGLLIAHGLKPDGSEQLLDNSIHIYPYDFFCPRHWNWGIPLKTTKNTISIHWHEMSWLSDEVREARKKKRIRDRIDYIIHFPNRLCMRIMGMERNEQMKEKLGKSDRR